MSSKGQWYVVHVLSGKEQRVKARLDYLVEFEGYQDVLHQVLVPTELVSEDRKGVKVESKRKFFPGYIMVEVDLVDSEGVLNSNAWRLVSGTDGVIGFAGDKQNPLPMRKKEVEVMLHQIKEREATARPLVSFELGDSVKINDGAFADQVGIIEELDQEKGKLQVSVSMFGRSMPVELDFWQVEKG